MIGVASSGRTRGGIDISSILFEWRIRRATRLLAVRDNRRLQAEIACATTGSARLDLIAQLDRLDDEQTSEIHGLLARAEMRQSWEQRRQRAGGLRPAL